MYSFFLNSLLQLPLSFNIYVKTDRYNFCARKLLSLYNIHLYTVKLSLLELDIVKKSGGQFLGILRAESRRVAFVSG